MDFTTIISILAAIVAVIGYVVYKRKAAAKQPPTRQPPTRPPRQPPAPSPAPSPIPTPAHDSEGRIRIPEVTALRGPWSESWWYAPWILRAPHNLDPTVVWQIRWACGCDENGVLGPCPGRGYEVGMTLGNPMTPYSKYVPRVYRFGTDRYGREKTIFQASQNDVRQPDGTWVAQRQDDKPVLLTDELTRATRAANGAELAEYLRKNNVSPTPAPAPGDWDGGVG